MATPQEYAESPEVTRIYESFGDIQTTIKQFDLDEQPGAAEKLGPIAEMAEGLSKALNDLCNCEHIRDAIARERKGSAV